MARTRKPEPTHPSFFKILLNGDGHSTKLRVPPTFVKNFKQTRLPTNFSITQKSDVAISWEVKLERSCDTGHCYFTNGWSNIVKDLKLSETDFLVFHLIGETAFEVAVYDRTCCEKNITSLTTDSEGVPGVGHRNVEIISDGSTVKQGRWKKVKVQREEEEEHREEQRDEKQSRPKTLSFVKPLARHQKYIFTLPAFFARESGISHMVNVHIRNHLGRKWPVKVVHRTAPNRRDDLVTGWSDFLRCNRIVVGDFLKFEIIRRGVIGIKVCNRIPKISHCDQSRKERIKESKERLQKLGIADRSQRFKASIGPKETPRSNSVGRPVAKKPTRLLPNAQTRHSSRLQDVTPVSYSEAPLKRKDVDLEDQEIVLEEGTNPEIYTEEHEKLLGNTKKSWELLVDDYGEDGKRINGPTGRKRCHQCRQNTARRLTHCGSCKLTQGQFCGDCLYMRYGEHVLEALENPNWVCPVCRGICNCSFCRRAKGWPATGSLYKKVKSLGYKSVAHYLIQTRRAQNDAEEEMQNSD